MQNEQRNNLKEQLSLTCLSEVEVTDEDACDKISTKIKVLDKITSGGIPCGHLTLLAASKGVGKTTIAIQILAMHAIFKEEPSLVFSGETSDGAVASKIINIIAGPRLEEDIDVETDKEFVKLDDVSQFKIKTEYLEKIFLLNPDVLISNRESRWQRFMYILTQAANDVKLIVIDNLMMLTDLISEDREYRGRDEYFLQYKIAMFLQRIAKTKDVAVVLIAHHSKTEVTAFGRMKTSDLTNDISGSSTIANLASLVLQMYRINGNAKLVVSKNRLSGRDTRSGDKDAIIDLKFDKKSGRLSSSDDMSFFTEYLI